VKPRDAGQSAVETAITMPLTLFLVLGTIQLFMSLQARLLAHYAVARATRAGSLTSGDCQAMLHTALLALLPSFARTDTAANLVGAFSNPSHIAGMFDPAQDGTRSEAILWMDRVHPNAGEIPRNGEDEEIFDLVAAPVPVTAHTLEVKLIFWFPLRVPFVNWVFSKMVLTQWSLDTLSGSNPLQPVQAAPHWNGGAAPLPGNVTDELRRRDQQGHYVLPIQTSFTMRMMTPARVGPQNFLNRGCTPGPLGGW
jgi:hypothetical protein